MAAKTTAAKKRNGTTRATAVTHAPEAATFSAGVVVGRLMPGSTPAAPVVDFAGNGAGPLRARTTVALDAATLERAAALGQEVTLVFENGDPRRPIVTGLLRDGPAATPFQELLVAPRAAASNARSVEARLDGERVILEGKNEVVLKCGEASLTLRRDGKVVLRGAYVETYAKGVNRIKGGSVKIN